MSILDTIKKIMPYLKTDSGYVLCRLSSQAVEMDDGLTLEQKVTSLNSLIESKVDTSSVVNNALTTEEGFVLDARQGKVMDDKITELNGKLDEIKVVRKAYPMTLEPNSYVGGNMGTFQIPSEDIQKYGHVISATFSGGSSAPGVVNITHYTGGDEWWAYVSCVDGTGNLIVQFLNVDFEFGN